MGFFMPLRLGDLLDRGTALKETEHVLLEKHGNFALSVSRGL
jgi:hypothetical protein